MPKMDFLGTEAKPTFRKRVHRPWNSKLLDAAETDREESPKNQEAVQLNSEWQSAVHSEVKELYSSHISMGGFLRLPTREQDTQSFPSILPNEIPEVWQTDLATAQHKNALLLTDIQQFKQHIHDLEMELALKQNEFVLEVSDLQAQLKLVLSEKDALETDYHNALQSLQTERTEGEQLQNKLLQETEALQTETARRVQAEHNESLLSEALANFEAESALLEKSKKALEAETKFLIEKRSKMDAINENEQKLRRLYEDKMKALHTKVFQLERELKVEINQKHDLEQKIAQSFESMKQVESEKKEIEQHNLMLEQEIKLQHDHLLDLEIKLKDEMKVRKAFESTFSDALSKN